MLFQCPLLRLIRATITFIIPFAWLFSNTDWLTTPLRSSYLSASVITTTSVSATLCSFVPLWGYFASAKQFPKFHNNARKTVLSPLCRMWQCLVSGLLTLLFPTGTPSLWFSLSGRFFSTRHRRFTFVQLCFTYTLLTFSTAAFDSSTSVSVCWVSCAVLSDGSSIIIVTTCATLCRRFLAHGVWQIAFLSDKIIQARRRQDAKKT